MSAPLYKLSDKALFTSVGDDVLALTVEDGQCYGMEKVTAAVWRLLAEPTSVQQLCDRLLELYEVEPEVCRSDVEHLLSLLRKEGLVQAVPAQAQ